MEQENQEINNNTQSKTVSIKDFLTDDEIKNLDNIFDENDNSEEKESEIIANNLDTLDIRSKLLLGRPITVLGIGDIYSLKIKEIDDIGFTKYYIYIAFLTYREEGIKNSSDIFKLCCEVSEMNKIFIEILSLFLKKDIKDIVYDGLNKCFIIDSKNKDNKVKDNNIVNNNTVNTINNINKDNFLVFLEVIKKQNCIEQSIKSKYLNDRAKQIAKRHRELRKRDGREEEQTDWLDIILSVSCKHSSINLLNIEELTIYQVMASFKKLNQIDNFNVVLQASAYGTLKEDAKYDHWNKRIK